jgi:hypothetical protein
LGRLRMLGQCGRRSRRVCRSVPNVSGVVGPVARLVLSPQEPAAVVLPASPPRRRCLRHTWASPRSSRYRRGTKTTRSQGAGGGLRVGEAAHDGPIRSPQACTHKCPCRVRRGGSRGAASPLPTRACSCERPTLTATQAPWLLPLAAHLPPGQSPSEPHR